MFETGGPGYRLCASGDAGHAGELAIDAA
jgi:hypothetical protein